MDFAAEGLLDGLEGDDRAARERLLQRLIDQGVGIDELKAAAAEDRLALLPVERVLTGSLTARDIEQQTGLPAAVMLHVRRALGLPEGQPDDKIFCEVDLEAARSTKEFLEAGFGEESILQISRVLGEAMARVSGATGAVFTETFLEPGDSEDEVAWRFANLAENLAPAFEPVLAAAFRAHVLDNVRRAMISRSELSEGRVAAEQDMTVCFIDLVGFTRLGSQVETQELGDVVGRFGELAAAAANPPVRLVKTIGDAALLVSREAGPLVEAALSLLEEVEAADLPPVRAGTAFGPTTTRAGDVYGHGVNLASRVTGLARPGSVLCTEEVRDQTPEEFDWSFAGRHRLKGIADAVPLYRARRLSTDGGAPERAGQRESPDGAGQRHDRRRAAADGRESSVRRPKAGRRRR